MGYLVGIGLMAAVSNTVGVGGIGSATTAGGTAPNSLSVVRAASPLRPGVTWLHVFSVSATVLWPSRCWTSFGCTPASSKTVAVVRAPRLTAILAEWEGWSADLLERQGVDRDQLTIHADRGSSMAGRGPVDRSPNLAAAANASDARGVPQPTPAGAGQRVRVVPTLRSVSLSHTAEDESPARKKKMGTVVATSISRDPSGVELVSSLCSR